MTMITPSYLGETIEYSSLHACRSTLEDPTAFLTFPAHPRLQAPERSRNTPWLPAAVREQRPLWFRGLGRPHRFCTATRQGFRASARSQRRIYRAILTFANSVRHLVIQAVRLSPPAQWSLTRLPIAAPSQHGISQSMRERSRLIFGRSHAALQTRPSRTPSPPRHFQRYQAIRQRAARHSQVGRLR